ncbi:BQ5605_C005g03406 [Microbotryum silenes-dioicae]|uniref:BQ5605_C005g03406 protein n=1 Tax=Microbotryum silenes-dioicae TaxID=796604 RepID=A0A2X0N4L3_9BASI|nr:BQ5605_C005g03406 [Microbotryum silenes-dioicae]
MGKLTFKGEPKKKKHKSRSTSSRHDSNPTSTHDDAYTDQDLSAWIAVPEPGLALGPLYLTLPRSSITSSPVCLALQPTTGKVHPFALPVPGKSAGTSAGTSAEDSKARTSLAATLDQEELEALVDYDPSSNHNSLTTSLTTETQTPTDIHHVWVCTRIPDSQDKITLRSATGKFLAADQFGQVTAEREARGMLEEWLIEPSSNPDLPRGTVVLKSCHGKLLSIDLVAGGKVEVSADTDPNAGIGPTEEWQVWMQGEYLAKAKQQLLERTGTKATLLDARAKSAAGKGDGLTIVGNLGGAEQEAIKRFQARGQGRYIGSEEDISELAKARRKGKLSEAMLDRRVKLKRSVDEIKFFAGLFQLLTLRTVWA